VSVYWQRTRNGTEAIEPAELPTLLAHTGKGGGGQDQFIHAADVVGALRTTDGGSDVDHGQANQLVVAHTLRSEGFDASEDGTGRGTPMTVAATGVRRLTPVECERLQGFPDGWTLVPDDAPDGRRYAAIGDAVTVPVSRWIGLRLLGAA
jgi:DNA (cytosine-5)-methyltransferase 1